MMMTRMVIIVVMIAVMIRDGDSASSRTTHYPKVGATQVYVALYGVFDNII